MSATPERIKKLADALHTTEHEIARALGQHLESPSLEKAYARYTDASPNSTDKEALLVELEKWIMLRVGKARTGEDYRVISGYVPEESERVLELNSSWDECVRTKLTNFRKAKHMPATRAYEIFKSARPGSREYFRSRSLFRKRFDMELDWAGKRGVTSLLFKLILIAEPKRRRAVEVILLNTCEAQDDLNKLLPLLSSKEDRVGVIKKLTKFIL